MPISTGLRIGWPACAARSAARPSQNWAICQPALSTVGVLRVPNSPRAPGEVVRLSTPAAPSRRWQLLQDWVSLTDSRGSWNSRRPSSMRTGVSFSAPGMAAGSGSM